MDETVYAQITVQEEGIHKPTFSTKCFMCGAVCQIELPWNPETLYFPRPDCPIYGPDTDESVGDVFNEYWRLLPAVSPLNGTETKLDVTFEIINQNDRAQFVLGFTLDIV